MDAGSVAASELVESVVASAVSAESAVSVESVGRPVGESPASSNKNVVVPSKCVINHFAAGSGAVVAAADDVAALGVAAEAVLDADAVVSPAPVEDAVSVADAVPVTLDAGTTTKLRARSTVLR